MIFLKTLLITIVLVVSRGMSSTKLKPSKTITWFRNDLRLHDNVLLQEAKASCSRGNDVLCLYCFDPRHFSTTPFGSIKCDSHRATFLLESVANLRKNLQSINSNLYIAVGKPEDVIPQLISDTPSSEVLMQVESAYEESQVEMAVERRLKSDKHSLRRLSSGASLYHLVMKADFLNLYCIPLSHFNKI